jgi:hypothetical protein
MSRLPRVLPALALVAASAGPAAAAEGDLDTAFAGVGSTSWVIVHDFFQWEVVTAAVVPADHELILVATRTFSDDVDLVFRVYDTGGEAVEERSCAQSTGSTFPFGVTSRGLAAALSDSGHLLVAGAIALQGSEATDRAFIARFDREAGGCELDPEFASAGFAWFDDFSFCDTESCSVLALEQIRRPTLAVTSTRIVLLVRSEVTATKGRLFLVGLTAGGEVDGGFDGNGVLEILAPGTDGFYGEAHLALDARGRIYVLATPFKEGGVTDTDLYLFRYLPGGGLDAAFSGDGVLPLVESISTDSTADDLRVASDGTVLVSGGTISGPSSFVRAVSADGVAGATLVESLLPAQLAVQGDGLLVTSAELPNEAGDGLRTRRRQFGTTGTFPLDATWGSGGTADHDYDFEPGEDEGDRPRHLELWGGRPVIVGGATGGTAEVTFAMRLESRYLFADGFEQARASLWSAVVTP